MLTARRRESEAGSVDVAVTFSWNLALAMTTCRHPEVRGAQARASKETKIKCFAHAAPDLPLFPLKQGNNVSSIGRRRHGNASELESFHKFPNYSIKLLKRYRVGYPNVVYAKLASFSDLRFAQINDQGDGIVWVVNAV